MEWRIVCSGQGEAHLFHAWSKPSFVKAAVAAEKNNADPVFDIPIPALQGCVLWYVESRFVGPWVDPLTEPPRRA